MSQVDCLFCKIRDGQVPSTRVFDDEQCFAFRDIHPAAPMHVLLVPRRHIATLNDLGEADAALVGHLLVVAAEVARKEGHAEVGWRTVFNVNRGAGQSVFHIHLHILGGRALGWPPG
jgi:histidine triad (HIT) family protein